MTPKSKKSKGRDFEKKVVSLCQDAGFAAERVYEQSGIHSGDVGDGVDVTVPLSGIDRTMQCKHWKNGFEPLYRILERAEIACVKGNRKEPLIAMRLSKWIELMREAESYRAPPVDGVQVIRFTDAAE